MKIDRDKFRESLWSMYRARERMRSSRVVCDKAKEKARVEMDVIKTVISMTQNREFLSD
jgi:hypothetical protein